MDTLSLGLALGGGGVRALAHIGVLKVFEAHNLQVNYLAGSSFGGFLAAIYASGKRASDMEVEAIRATRPSQLMRLVDPSVHGGLLQGARVKQYLSGLVGANKQFCELSIPLALSAVDLPTGREVVLTEGNVVEAAMATVAVPGIFPEVRLGEYELVDGGVLNNVPAELLRVMGAEKLVAVDVNLDFPRPADINSTEASLPALFPHPLKDIYQSMQIMASTITRRRLELARPDVIIRPVLPAPVTIFWGFHLTAEIIKAGERAAEEALPPILG